MHGGGLGEPSALPDEGVMAGDKVLYHGRVGGRLSWGCVDSRGSTGEYGPGVGAEWLGAHYIEVDGTALRRS
jgi:hypothetical protein